MLGPQDGLGTSPHASRDRKLVARIKDTMLHPITEMKARKRKATPGIIDLTCPTQKRPRSANGKDIIFVDEDTGTSQPTIVGGKHEPGRSPSVEIQDQQSLTKGDAMKHVLGWSRLSMKQIRSVLANLPIEHQLTILTGRRTSTKSFTSP